MGPSGATPGCFAVALADFGILGREMSEESATPDLTELVRRSVEAAARGDLDAHIAFYTHDAVWDASPMGIGTFEGQVAMRGFWEDWLSSYEGWGLQVHEAMVAGVPVTVANNTTMPEIAGNAADTFDPHDTDDMSRSMERILTDKALRDTLIARGLEQVKHFSWREAAEATLAVCASLDAH